MGSPALASGTISPERLSGPSNSIKTPTSSTPGSPPASGPSARWAGPSRPTSLKWTSTSPPPCSITGQDILFFWVARMMMMQLAVVDEVPFHDRLPPPARPRREGGEDVQGAAATSSTRSTIIDDYGADALRMATMAQMAALGGVLKLSVDRIKGYAELRHQALERLPLRRDERRLREPRGHRRNTEHQTDAIPHRLQTVNLWIVGETAQGPGRGRCRPRKPIASTTPRTRSTPSSGAGSATGTWSCRKAPPDGRQSGNPQGNARATMAWVLDQCDDPLAPLHAFRDRGTLADHRHPDDAARSHADWPAYTASRPRGSRPPRREMTLDHRP